MPWFICDNKISSVEKSIDQTFYFTETYWKMELFILYKESTTILHDSTLTTK